jgi:sigma-B regulation protein RsbU (phosphoserine phosphatase)
MLPVSPQSSDLSILVIEDDQSVLDSLMPILASNQRRVVLAADPAAGLERFHSACPDLVIVNVDLPDAGKFAAIEQLLQLAPELPIIVLAKRGNPDDLLRALRLGVSDYLLLPLDSPDILEHSIGTSLRKARLVGENMRIRRKLEQSNAELQQRIQIFQQDQQAGRHVQINMMPIPPKDIGGFHFNHKVVPSLYLSGDTVDYKPAGRHETLFYIADVSGHGSSSAFITVLLRFRIDQMRIEHLRGRFEGEFSPAHILAMLNRDLLKTRLDKHVTIFMGMLNDKTRQLRYSVAGHHPLPILYTDGAAQSIPVARSSFPIGLFEEADYFDETLPVSDDFALVLFSDGILEVLKQGDYAAKEARLVDVVQQSRGRFEEIKAALAPPKSMQVPDDIAIMSVTRAPGAPPE